MTVLIDDQLLAAHLRGRWSPDDPDTYTTGYWYVRLCTAVALARGGSLAGPFEALPPHRRAAARRAVLSLPDHVRLLSLRELAPLMGSLAQRHAPLNVLAREALAAAVTLDATVLMAAGNENRSLADALGQEGRSSEIVTTP